MTVLFLFVLGLFSNIADDQEFKRHEVPIGLAISALVACIGIAIRYCNTTTDEFALAFMFMDRNEYYGIRTQLLGYGLAAGLVGMALRNAYRARNRTKSAKRIEHDAAAP